MASSGNVETRIGERLIARSESLATAESCSGGLIAHRITAVPGASRYFHGGVVAYSNDAKTGLLGVARETLAQHGAVSEQVAHEMAEGARARLKADHAVAVTGIAGPGGGTREKPVGLVYTAVAGPRGTAVMRHLFKGTREEIKQRTADEALRLLSEQLA